MDQTSYSLQDFLPGSKALAVKQNREVEVVSSAQKGENLLVKVKNFDEGNPERIVTLSAVVNGEVFLKPIGGTTAPAAETDEFFEEPATAAVEETPVQPIVEKAKKEKKEKPVKAKAEKEEEPSEEDKLRGIWKDLGLAPEIFDLSLKQPNGLNLIREMTGRLHTAQTKAKKARKKAETDWTKSKLDKYAKKGTLEDVDVWMEKAGLLATDTQTADEIEGTVEDFIELIRKVPNAAQYTGEFLKVKTKQINTNIVVAFTEMYRRLMVLYPDLVENKLVDDLYTFKAK